MKPKVLIILCLVFINFSSLIAQKVTNFTTFNGLVNNTVFSIFEDNNNDLWFGTDGGLGKWMSDEDTWTIYTQEGSPLVTNKVNAILQDNMGHLWFGTDKGLNEFDGENWKTYTHQMLPDSLRAEHILCLFFDTKNNLWIGTKGGGVTKRYRDKGAWKWEPYYTANSGIVSDNIKTINEDSLGNIWFGTLDAGVCKFDGNSNWAFYSDSIEIGDKINIIFKDHDDQLWFGTSYGVFGTYDGTRWDCYESVPTVRSIAEDREGNLWLGTENDGLYKYDRISCFKPQIDGLVNVPEIWSLIRDHNGYLWLGTDGAGVYRLHLNWQTFNKENSGLADNNITSIAEDKSGNLWIATAFNGIARYDGLAFNIFNVDGSWSGTNSVYSIIVDKDNWIWCATENGAHKFDGNPSSWISYLDSQVVYTVIQDQNDIYWFGTRNGVSRFDGDFWTSIDTSNGFPALIVTTIFEDHSGYLWFGTYGGGVCKFDGDSVIAVYDTSNGLIDNKVTAIIQDRDFCYWFGTMAKGISKYDGTSWNNFTKENSGLPDNKITSLLKDTKDNTWIGTYGGGLCKLDGERWVNYSIKQVSSDNINDIFQDTSGNFWFATEDAGLVKYIPDIIPPETIITFKPNNIISDTTIVFIFSGNDIETPKGKLVYSWAVKDDQSRYIQNWSNYSKENYCQVHLPGDGSYTFLVKAIDEEGNEDPTPARFKFTVDSWPPTTIIHYPAGYEILKNGNIAIIGTACDTSQTDNFKKLWMDYAEVDFHKPNQRSNWNIIEDTLSTPVINDTLADWDASEQYGYYYLKLSAMNIKGNISDATIQIQVVDTLAEVYKEKGGLLKCSQHKTQLFIPPWALEKDTGIYFSRVKTYQIPSLPEKTFRYCSIAYETGPDEILLQQPATLTVHYLDSDITGLDEKKLSLMCIDDLKMCGGWVNSEKNIISTTIKKFGTYILVESDSPEPGKGTILDLNCQPRIFSPLGTGFSETTNISFNLQRDSEISLKIYNLGGRLVRVLHKNETMRSGAASIPWDGRDYNGNICPSDLYIVTFECEKNVKTKTVMILDRSQD